LAHLVSALNFRYYKVKGAFCVGVWMSQLGWS
jgi:hypothetical protein